MHEANKLVAELINNGSAIPDDTDIEILFRWVQLYDVTVNFISGSNTQVLGHNSNLKMNNQIENHQISMNKHVILCGPVVVSRILIAEVVASIPNKVIFFNFWNIYF